MNTKDQLIEYIKAGMPIIQIKTQEYNRAEDIILSALEVLKEKSIFQVFKWDAQFGLVNEYNTTAKPSFTVNPIQAILQLMENNAPSISIFRNLDMQLEASNYNIVPPALIETMLHFHKIGEVSGKHIIIIGNKTMVEELRSYIAVIDMPLPNEQEITEIVDTFSQNTLDMKLPKEELKTISIICSGMDSKEIVNSISIAVTKRGKKYEIDKKVLMAEKAKIVRKSGLLEWIEVEETIDDIGGLDNLKEWFMKASKAFKNPEKALQYGLPLMKGAMIIGVSGTGKTLTAKVISNLFGVPLFRLDIGRLFEGVVGATERNVRELFKVEDAVAPCVILIDEIEKSLAGVESSGHSDSGVTARLIGAYLYRLQEKKVNSFHVCTANRVDLLPPELMRKGRFDEIWYVGLPNEEELEQILRIHIRKTGRDINNYDIDKIIKYMNHFTGAEVEATIKQAMYNAFNEDREYTTEDIVKVAKETKALAETKKEEIIALESWAKNRVRFASSSHSKPVWAGEKTMRVIQK